jgi:hypothetical protein
MFLAPLNSRRVGFAKSARYLAANRGKGQGSAPVSVPLNALPLRTSERICEVDLCVERGDTTIRLNSRQAVRKHLRLVGFLAQSSQPQRLRPCHRRDHALLNIAVTGGSGSHRISFLVLDFMFVFCSNKPWTTESIKFGGKLRS